MVTVGETYQVEIVDMGQNGEGIGRIDGIAVFIRGAVAGDLCSVEITQVKKNFAFGRVKEVLRPSAYRIEPACSYAADCGGCSLANVSYEGQLWLKEKQIKDNLERIGGVKNPRLQPILDMEDPYRYRNNGQFPTGYHRGEPVVGFYKAKTHTVVDCPDCMLQSEPAILVAQVIRQYMKETGISVYDEKTGKGVLRHIVVRNAEGTGEVMVILVVNQGKVPEQEELVWRLKEAFDRQKEESQDGVVWELRSVVLNINKGKSQSVLGDKNIFLYGQERIIDHFEGLDYMISPRSFYQVNTKQMGKLYETVKVYAGLTGMETVFDLYCGVGTISLYLAKHAKRVMGIESVKESILDANRNAIKNEIVNAVFTCGKAEYVLPELVEKGTRANVAVLDPPRAGCDQKLLDAVAQAGVERIVYVSCNPSTLARDVKYLQSLGYSFVEAQPIDLFPWTVHVETVVKFIGYKGGL